VNAPRYTPSRGLRYRPLLPLAPHGTMKKLLTLVACVALLSGCDFVGGSDAEPVAFSDLTLTSVPLRDDEDGSAPDLYVEIQDASGRAVYKSSSILEDVDDTAFPYTLDKAGALAGSQRAYFVVVMDRDADGFDLLAASGAFSADDLRAATEPAYVVTNEAGTFQAEIALSR
jgi:hypothetical protein